MLQEDTSWALGVNHSNKLSFPCDQTSSQKLDESTSVSWPEMSWSRMNDASSLHPLRWVGEAFKLCPPIISVGKFRHTNRTHSHRTSGVKRYGKLAFLEGSSNVSHSFLCSSLIWMKLLNPDDAMISISGLLRCPSETRRNVRKRQEIRVMKGKWLPSSGPTDGNA